MHPSALTSVYPIFAYLSADDRQALFDVFKDDRNGQPDSISKDGCLALARCGKVIWNLWRTSFPTRQKTNSAFENIANFQGHTFDAEVNFANFEFGDGADFKGAIFKSDAHFEGASFGCNCSFIGVTWYQSSFFDNVIWDSRADFSHSEFIQFSNFSGSKWGPGSRFRATKWHSHSNFSNCEWSGNAYFKGAGWARFATFKNARWIGEADFRGTQWGDQINFSGSVWHGEVNFQGRTWERLRADYDKEEEWKNAKENADRWGLSPKSFLSIDFSNCEFHDKVDFSDRAFKDSVNFVLTKFSKAPIFHGCELHQDISFDGAKFPAPSGKEEDTRAYRTLKLAFNKQQAVREEQRFFIHEMNEERLSSNWVTKLLYSLYRLLSNYGFSLFRPFILWLLVVTLLAGAYASSGRESCFVFSSDCYYTLDSFNSSLTQSLPLIGLEKLIEFKVPLKSLELYLIAIHKLLTFLAIFLFGLALRNKFKLK